MAMKMLPACIVAFVIAMAGDQIGFRSSSSSLVGPLTAPPSTGWSWDNQSSATVDTTNGLSIVMPANQTGTQVYYRTAPSPPYTITALFQSSPTIGTNNGTGLAWRQSSTGKLYTFKIINNASTATLAVWKWTNSTTFSVSPLAANIGPISAGMWLRIADNNTNLIFSVSGDGQHWNQFFSEARGTFMTGGPNQYGICGTAGNATIGVTTTLLSLVES